MKKFSEVVDQNLGRLEQYVPVVAKVHGGTHPEFHDVKKLFDKISEKIKNIKSEKPNLDNELKQLREITKNYTVPDDVCESYESVYNMLEELDKSYKA
ncbi:iron-sulfur cluster repair di-iron protein, ric [Tissierella pigra]|nr:iron-sulfur cluster repair di-iron protein, ric [Tissierella pigra]